MSQEKEASVNLDFKKFVDENIPVLENWPEKSASAIRAELAKVTAERDELRKIISKTVEAVGNGSAVSAEASLEFMKEIPNDVRLGQARIKAEIARLKPFEDWVTKEGRHSVPCHKNGGDDSDSCTCGLDALLNQKEAK